MPHAHHAPAQGTVPASSTLVPGLQLSAVLGIGFVGAILVLDGGHSFDTCRAVGQSGLGGCATLWANLAILGVVIALVLLPVTMMLIRASRLRRHQSAPRLASAPARQAWTPAPLPPARPRFIASAPPVTRATDEPERWALAPRAESERGRSMTGDQAAAPVTWTPPGPSYIQPLLDRSEPALPRGGADLEGLKRDFQALKAQLEASEPTPVGGEVVPFSRPAPVTTSALLPDEPTPA